MNENNDNHDNINNIPSQNSFVQNINNTETYSGNFFMEDSVITNLSFLDFNSNFNLFQTIQTMMNQINNQNIYNYSNTTNTTNNDNDIVQFNIEIELVQPGGTMDDDEDNDNNDDTENKIFKSCKDINEKLGKSKKIDEELCNNKLRDESCFICIDKYKKSELLRTLPKCNHYLHKKCIDKWLIKYNANCPVCRALVFP